MEKWPNFVSENSERGRKKKIMSPLTEGRE